MNEQIEQRNNNVIRAPENDHQTQVLSKKETREILTPFAFEIDKTLYGTKLAQPSKRGIAILIDLALIAMLSSAPGELLAIVFAITLYKLGSNQRAKSAGKITGQKRRKFMRFVAAFILFIILSSILPTIFDRGSDFVDGSSSSHTAQHEEVILSDNISDTIKIAAAMTNAIAKLTSSDCQQLNCWQQNLLPSVQTFDQIDMSITDKKELIKTLVDETNLNHDDKQQLSEFFYQELSTVEVPSTEQVISEEEPSNKPDAPVYSLIELIKGIIDDDLGLGFGWAAFYFTVFTSLWKGQTPGKKLLSIQVVQLDGTPLSMWDSFGRYGGYGAGIATGLLGFIQIFWNANRQAIHDQISATVVVEKEI